MGTYSQLIQPADVSGAYFAGQKARRDELDFQRQQMEAQRLDQARELYGRYLAGNQQAGQLLQRYDPAGFQQAEQNRAKLAEMEQQRASNAATMARQAQEEAAKQTVTFGNMMRAVKAAPDPAHLWGIVTSQARELGLPMAGTLPQNYDPQIADEYIGLADSLARRQDERYQRYLLAMQDWPKTQPRPNFDKWLLEHEKAGASNISVDTGNRALEKPAAAQAQEAIMEKNDILSMMEPLYNPKAEKWLTVGSRAQQWINEQRDKLGDNWFTRMSGMVLADPEKAELRDVSDFVATIDDIGSTIKRQRLGGAQTNQELAGMANVLLNTTQGYQKFAAIRDRMAKVAQAAIDARDYWLQRGMSANNPMLGENIDMLLRQQGLLGHLRSPKAQSGISAPASKRPSQQQLDALRDKLKAAGRSDEQIDAVLRSKGWR